MLIDLTPIIQALISLLAILITSKLIPWIKSKTSVNQQSALSTAAKIAVYAAEQIYGAGKGEEKLDYVVTRLEEKGFTVDMDTIEAAVREMNIIDKLNAPLTENTEKSNK